MGDFEIRDDLAICETKARYCRCLDTKDWSGYGDVFTPDVHLDSSPSGGTDAHGRENVVTMVRQSVETAKTAHQVHSPEITFVDADTADVIWAMQDRVVWDDAMAARVGHRGLVGYGEYLERYVRSPDGKWRISKSVLMRFHMDFDK
jgi:hypothetical protein